MANLTCAFGYNLAMTANTITSLLLSDAERRRARLSRDARFDGLFFVGVKTTGIFCRSICPVALPREANVEYFDHASTALQRGYRPCLRCRPDSAPGSCAWRGTDTTFSRAVDLIDSGALQTGSLTALTDRLGISDRYLRRLFTQRLGISPKAYALYGQVMFAKKLLHETGMSISAVASAAGFNSQRRFNDAFVKCLRLSPSAIRRGRQTTLGLQLSLAYRPPLAWDAILAFWRKRSLAGVEWVTEQSYGRSFILRDGTKEQARGFFSVTPQPESHHLILQLAIDKPAFIKKVVMRVRQILDLDADLLLIEQQLAGVPGFAAIMTPGLRIPGIWDVFEAGVRAILGQQVSVAAARTHLQRLVAALGEPLSGVEGLPDSASVKCFFPTASAIADNSLTMLNIPESRRETLRQFARAYLTADKSAPIRNAPLATELVEKNLIETWLQIKGIGRWTIDYLQMRALGHTDIWLAGDLGIKKATALLGGRGGFDHESLKPWRSYATFHLWNALD